MSQLSGQITPPEKIKLLENLQKKEYSKPHLNDTQ